MEWAAAIVGMCLGALVGWSLQGWVEGREHKRIQAFYRDLDEIRQRRNGGGL